jgi:Putative auto-transporter adhesin, head GIN domain
MKNTFALFALLFFSTIAFAQDKEKIKGSKVVTIEQKEIKDFESLEVEDNLEVFLIKGDKCGIEIEADDNLHDEIIFFENGGNLQISSKKEVTSSKKFSVRITYTDSFKMATAKEKANITALSDISLNDFTFKTFDNAKVFANVVTKKFTLMANDKSKIELNLKSEETTIDMSKNAVLKALISSNAMKFDMYQKTSAVVEGDVIDLKLRLDNNADFTGKNLATKNSEITTEGYTNCSILVSTKATIDARGKSEIQLFGEQRIDIKNFLDSATLFKKPSK